MSNKIYDKDKTYLHIGKNNTYGDISEAIMKAIENFDFPITVIQVIRLILDNPQTQDKMGITKQQKFCEDSCKKAQESHEAYIKDTGIDVSKSDRQIKIIIKKLEAKNRGIENNE